MSDKPITTAWLPIEIHNGGDAPVLVCDNKRGYVSVGRFIKPEWECTDYRGTLMGLGFYPTHYIPLQEMP